MRIIAFSNMMNSLTAIILYLPYLVIRYLIHLIRDLNWWINGTDRLVKQYESTGDLERCAHVLRIIGRYKLDPIIPGNKLLDFIIVHEKLENLDYVLKEEVTLYMMTDDAAIFVESEPGKSPWNMSEYGFSREAQHKMAKNLIILPIHAAYRLAERIGRPKGQMIFIQNMTRCGSTLLCQMFHSTHKYIVYNEPSVINDLIEYSGNHDCPWIAKHIRATVSLLCKTTESQDILGHVIKPAASASEVLVSMQELFPDDKSIFIYRDYIPTVRSLYSVYASLASTIPAGLLKLMSRSLFIKFHSFFHNVKASGPIIVCAGKTIYAGVSYLPLLSLVIYHKNRNKGHKVAAVKFEHILHNPESAMGIIFKHCGVPESLLPVALQALDDDSQTNSIINRKRLSKVKAPEFTDEARKEISNLCEKYSIADVFENMLLPGTITEG